MNQKGSASLPLPCPLLPC